MPHPLQVYLLTSKAVSESRVTWATSVIYNFSIHNFIGLSVLDLDQMYRQTSDAYHHRLIPPPYMLHVRWYYVS